MLLEESVMSLARVKAIGMSCACFLFVVMSATLQAADFESTGSALSIEAWVPGAGKDLPVLSFDNARLPNSVYEDIRVENVSVDADGSTRFQLSHSGAMSRQVFAHVRRVEQDDGYTRSIITNLADGQQMEYLSASVDDRLHGKFDKESANEMLIQAARGEDQSASCPWCVWAGILISEVTCATTTLLAYDMCRTTCRPRGGVARFESGICGVYNSECSCMLDPKRINDEF